VAVGIPPLRLPRLAGNFALLSGGELISKTLGLAVFADRARTRGTETFEYLDFTLAIIFFRTLNCLRVL
jgi:hypothetical protein